MRAIFSEGRLLGNIPGYATTPEAFHKSLEDEYVKDEDYEYTKRVWKSLDAQTRETTMSFTYTKTFCSDVFQNFYHTCLEHYGFDSGQYYSSLSLSWDALLKVTGVESLKYIRHGSVRGKMPARSHCYYLQTVHEDQQPLGYWYNPSRPTNNIMCFNMNTLYGGGLS